MSFLLIDTGILRGSSTGRINIWLAAAETIFALASLWGLLTVLWSLAADASLLKYLSISDCVRSNGAKVVGTGVVVGDEVVVGDTGGVAGDVVAADVVAAGVIPGVVSADVVAEDVVAGGVVAGGVVAGDVVAEDVVTADVVAGDVILGVV